MLRRGEIGSHDGDWSAGVLEGGGGEAGDQEGDLALSGISIDWSSRSSGCVMEKRGDGAAIAFREAVLRRRSCLWVFLFEMFARWGDGPFRADLGVLVPWDDGIINAGGHMRIRDEFWVVEDEEDTVC